MPPLPRITSPLITEIARGVRFESPGALLRVVERAEALAADVEQDATLPGEWVVFKLIGARPERWPQSPELQFITGAALLANISALAEHLTDLAGWTWDDAAAAGAVDRPTLAKALNVSQKSVDRLTREGLVARRAKRRDGKTVLAFMPGVVESCRTRHGVRLAEAGGVTRLSRDERDAIVRLAARYHRLYSCSLNKTAAAIAKRMERSLETIRQILRTEEALRESRGERAIFGEAGPVQEKSRRWMERAWRRGAEPVLLAKRARCGRPAVQRAINLQRHARLLSLIDSGALTPLVRGEWTLPLGAKPPSLASHPLLTHARVRTGLGRPGVTDLTYLLEAARQREVVPPRDERAMLAGYHALRVTAGAWIASTPRLNPQSEPLDLAETALRWAARLKAELLRPLWTLIVETIETLLGKPAQSLSPDRLIPLLWSQLAVASDAVDQTDVWGGGRLAGATALNLSTSAARWLKAHPVQDNPGRASRVIPAGVEIADWTRAVAPWQSWLEPDRRFRPLLSKLAAPHAELFSLRMGWAESRPLTLSECAKHLKLSRIAVPRLERAATREALEIARGIRG